MGKLRVCMRFLGEEMRDKFLTEAMGECWHELSCRPSNNYCLKCEKSNYVDGCVNNNFSTWQSFGKLWEWAKGQEWLDDFLRSKPHRAWLIPIAWVHPDNFANALYEFLKERE